VRARHCLLRVGVRAALPFAVVTGGVAGCGALIGLEDRDLRADGGSPDGDSGGGREGSSGEDGGSGDDGSVDGDTDGAGSDSGQQPCETRGAAVLEFKAGDESWRYDVGPSPSTSEGFNFVGIPFHLLRTVEPILPDAKRSLYMKREKGLLLGDYFATLRQTDLAAAYDIVATMFAVYEVLPPAKPPPGTVEINVIVRDSAPLRHRLLVGKVIVPVGWRLDNRTFYACP